MESYVRYLRRINALLIVGLAVIASLFICHAIALCVVLNDTSAYDCKHFFNRPVSQKIEKSYHLCRMVILLLINIWLIFSTQ